MPFCTTHFRTYPEGHTGCITCYQNEAKTSTATERKQMKQATDLAKARERQIKPNAPAKKQSKSNQREQAELARIKKEMLAEHPFCFTTGEYVTADTCDLSHIIPRGNKKFVTERLNLVLEAREAHVLYENYKSAYAVQYPIQWDIKLERARQLSETHYQKLKDKAE